MLNYMCYCFIGNECLKSKKLDTFISIFKLKYLIYYILVKVEFILNKYINIIILYLFICLLDSLYNLLFNIYYEFNQGKNIDVSLSV